MNGIHEDMRKIIGEENDKIENSKYTSDFRKIFWQQQAKASQLSNAKGMRWHPIMIRWCIYLRHLSQKAYETLKQSDCIILPSQRTLRDYTHHFKSSPGFSADLDLQLCQTAKLHLDNNSKYVLLLIDEMHVKEDLVFNKNTGEMTGFTNLGTINDQLLKIEAEMENESSDDDISYSSIANSIATFMVRGLLSNLQFPYVYFPCRNITGDLLFDPLWEAVGRLEQYEFKVQSCT